MPNYEYGCTPCKTEFVLNLSMTMRNQGRCPDCKACAYRRYTAVPIIFKGKGFYSTDNRKQPDPKE